MGKTKIEWTDYTFNPWWGCTKVSEGCAHCYAERMAHRYGVGWGNEEARRFFNDKHWYEPLAWNRAAEREGVRRRVFCGSMCDVFEAGDDALNGQRARLWELIKLTPALDWLLLTKRPENIEGMLLEVWSSLGYWRVYEECKPNPFPRNVWLGVSAENKGRFDERWPVLESVGRRWYVPVLFVSVEPMLGPLRIENWLEEYGEHEDDNVIETRGVDWVICGGESGPWARPMELAWVRSLRDQCREAEVPFFFKGWGEHVTLSRAGGSDARMSLVEKKENRHILDGREWREWPEGVLSCAER